MKKTELRRIIREEIQRLNESKMPVKTIKRIMDKFKNADPVKAFPDFAQAVYDAGYKYWIEKEPGKAYREEEHIPIGSKMMVSNFAYIDKHEQDNIPEDRIILRSGPKNKWVMWKNRNSL